MIENRDKFAKILKDLEKEIKDPKDLEIAKNKILEICMLFIDLNNKMFENNENNIEELSYKVDKMQKVIKKMEDDFYVDDEEDKLDKIGDQMHDNEININYDEDYEFEIKCPYCNYEFVIGPEANLKDIIECPKCHKEIELDWDDYCDGECGHCENICFDKEAENQSLKEDDEGYNQKNGQLEELNNREKTNKKNNKSNQTQSNSKNYSNKENNIKNTKNEKNENNENEDDM